MEFYSGEGFSPLKTEAVKASLQGFSADEIADLLGGDTVEYSDGQTDWEYSLAEDGWLISRHCGHGAGCFWTEWE